jgi:hypothetical protein
MLMQSKPCILGITALTQRQIAARQAILQANTGQTAQFD